MSCNKCATKFGMFTKEKGCAKCGFAFCDKCLSEKMKINEKNQKVCKGCFTNQAKPVIPPKALQRRLEELENPSSHPIIVYKENPKRASLRKDLSQEDMEIVERLEKLKLPRKKSVPSTEEVAERLARLDSAKSLAGAKSNLPPPETRTTEQQAQDLFDQMSDLKRIESSMPKPEDEIAARLSQLKGEQSPKVNMQDTTKPEQLASKSISDQEDDLDEVERLMQAASKEAEEDARKALRQMQADKELQERLKEIQPKKGSKDVKEENTSDLEDSEDEEERMIQKLLAQTALDTELDESPEEQKPELDSDELPWCTLCNEDAALRCCGCDGDLYCRRCFKEAHDELDFKDHKTTPFKK